MSNGLGPRARALVDAARMQESELDAATRARMHAKVASSLGLSSAAGATKAALTGATLGAAGAPIAATTAAVGGRAALKLAAIALLALAVAGESALGIRGSTSQLRGPAQTPSVAPTAVAPSAPALHEEPAPTRPSEPTTQATTRSVESPLPRGPAQHASTPVLPTALPLLPPDSGAPTVSVTPPESDSAGPAPTTSATTSSNHAFERELGAVDRARAAQARGDHTQTLFELEGVGPGLFTEERAALRILALCGSGRMEQGRQELARFQTSFPSSLQSSRLSRACVTDPDGGGH